MDISKTFRLISADEVAKAHKYKIEKYISGQGINSSIYEIKDQNGSSAILKMYNSKDNSSKKRLLREVAFLAHGEKSNINSIPRLQIINEDESWVIMTKINGKQVKSLGEDDYRQILDFLDSINDGLSTKEYPYNAKEAVTCPDIFTTQCVKRYEGLKHYLQKIGNIQAEKFLENSVCLQLSEGVGQINLLKDAFTGFEERSILTPSDIGAHNILSTDGKLNFIDFEYSGMDDLAKTCVDLFFNPNNIINEKNNPMIHFQKVLNHLSDNDNGLPLRVKAVREILIAKWAMIILKKYITDTDAIDIGIEITDSYLQKANEACKAIDC